MGIRHTAWLVMFALGASVSRADDLKPEFVRDVVPALTKLGCNAGACHGSFQGRGGLTLSLWGFDPAADHRQLVSNARGRRVTTAAPQRSLMLLKGTMSVPHGGGRRLTADSESYRLIRAWIEQGAAGPGEKDPQLVRIDVEPREILLKATASQPLQVRASWSDGQTRDVTRWAQFETRLEQVAAVGPDAVVKAEGPGRTAITVRYQGQVVAVPVTVPFAGAADLSGFAPVNVIDQLMADDWTKVGVTPAGPCDDAEFLRRVSLDLIGTLPTVDEARAFLASTETDKRAKLIERLLARPEYAEYWAIKWSDLLRAHRRSLGEKGLASFNAWLRDALRRNRPWNEIVRELLTAQGNLYTTGPVAFFFVNQTPQELAEATAQVFLGIRMQCARCHHHPFEVWGQDDYHGLAAFFARVERKDTKENGRFGGAQAISLASTGQVTHPDTGQPLPPRLLGKNVPVEGDVDLRTLLAERLTAPENPWFARNVVNRYWGALFGRGLVDPIDDLRETNPASNAPLFDALAKDFVAHNGDLKHLLRTICNSRTYQLASEVAPTRDVNGAFFTHRVPRRLPAEVLLDAINQATGTTEIFQNFPIGTRAISLPDPAVESYFLDTFGRPLRTTTCECERPMKPDLRQVLHLSNGEALNAKICSSAGRVASMLSAGKSDPQMIEELYLATLSRFPLPEELAQAQKVIASAPSRKEGVEDLLWTLLNVTEFAVNH